MSDTVSTPSETDGEERWTLWSCKCGFYDLFIELDGVETRRSSEPTAGVHRGCGMRAERIEVVPLVRLGELHDELAAEFTDRMVAEARAEAAETALREAEEAAQDFIESSAPTGYSPLDRRAYNDARDALNEVLKRARTTTTEEVPDA
jgi:hypothetical protein